MSQGEWTVQVEQALQQQEEAEERMKKQSQALEDYRQWRKDFDSGLTTTNEKNSDNEMKES